MLTEANYKILRTKLKSIIITNYKKMKETKHKCEYLKPNDECVFNIRHETNGNKNKLSIKGKVIKVNSLERNVLVLYEKKEYLIDFNEFYFIDDKLKNERKAGVKPKYKADVKTKTIHWLIPIEIENDLREFVDKKSKKYKMGNY